MSTNTLVSKVEMSNFGEILESMGVEYEKELSVDLIIGEDLEMDSQEIVELLCEFEDRFDVKLDDGVIKRNDTIGQVLKKVNNLLLPQESSINNRGVNPYAHSRTDSIVINTTIEEMVEAIWNLYRWEERLDHIKSINVLYDDGYNQEFLMTVQNNNNCVKVRSIRRMNPNNTIEFFQPEPPIYLRHHTGSWAFLEVDGQVKVTLKHEWNINEEKIPALYPGYSLEETSEFIQQELLEHAEATLSMWKSILEG